MANSSFAELLERDKSGVGKKSSSLMKPEVYRAITIGDKYSFTLEDNKQSVAKQVSPQMNTVLHIAASLGHYHLVKPILNRYPELVYSKNSTGDLALHLAASTGHQLIVECMVGYDYGNRQIYTGNGQLDILTEENKEKNTALHVAMKNHHYELARFLVERNPKVSISLNQEQMSPLYMAAEAGHRELVNLMITENRTDEITVLTNGKSLVHAAIKGWNRDVLDAVMRYQSTDSPELVEGSSSLFIPFDDEEGRHSFCPILIDEEGRTPLSFAASIGYLDGVRYFLDKTSDATYIREGNGFFPIHWASNRGHVKIIDEFLKRFPDSRELINEKGQNILHVAAESGKANLVHYMLQMPEFEMLINERDIDGNTPLHLATKGGHARVVSILAWHKRVKLELINNNGLTAMDVALNCPGTMPSFPQRLAWLALRYAGAPRAPWPSSLGQDTQSASTMTGNKQKTITMRRNTHSTKTMRGNTQCTDTMEEDTQIRPYKDWVNTLLLVATLVATVTFAAGFTMPGGYNDSDPNQGMATLVQKSVFHVFLISNTIAMYSSIVVAIILILAQLGDESSVIASLKLAVPLLGLALTMVTLTFMVGVYSVVSNLHWLAIVVLIMGSISLLALLVSISLVAFMILLVPFFFPSSLNHHISQYIFRYPIYLLILVAGREADAHTKEKFHTD